jgi:hypothetical protein
MLVLAIGSVVFMAVALGRVATRPYIGDERCFALGRVVTRPYIGDERCFALGRAPLTVIV